MSSGVGVHVKECYSSIRVIERWLEFIFCR
jgi:hypothetical protein